MSAGGAAASRAPLPFAWLRRAFALDLRSVAALRVALGLSVLLTLASYAGVYRDFVLRGTVVSVEAVRALTPEGARIFLAPFDLAPRPAALLLLPGLGAAGIALTLGWRSRASCFACWLLLAALHARAPVLLNFGDQILLRALFWSCALPLGLRAALDARRVRAPAVQVVSSAGSAALLLQFCAIYFVAGAVKTGAEWGPEASAVHYVLGQKWMATPLAGALHLDRELSGWISRAVPPLEQAMPVLLLTPWLQAPARLLAVAGVWCFHAGLALFLDLGPFPLVCMGLATVFLPGAFWGALARLRGSGRAASPAPAGRMLAGGRLSAALLLPLGLLAAGHALETLTGRRDLLPAPLRRVGEALALSQPWTMYAPGVDHWDGWMSARARLAGEGEIDLLRGGAEFSDAPPPQLPWSGQSFRGTLLLDSVTLYPHLFARPYLRRLCRQWNRAHPDAPVESVALLRVYVDLEQPHAPVRERRPLSRLRCPSRVRPGIATSPEFG